MNIFAFLTPFLFALDFAAAKEVYCPLPEIFSKRPITQSCQQINDSSNETINDCMIASHLIYGFPLAKEQRYFLNFLNCSPAVKFLQSLNIFNQSQSTERKNVHPECFYQAMQQSTGSYVSCKNNDTTKYNQSTKKNCIDLNQFKKIWLAYHDVARCFNFDPRMYFGLFLHESRFHPNAGRGSSSGARCMGQLTSIGFNGVKEVMRGRHPIVFKLQNTEGKLDYLDSINLDAATRNFCDNVIKNVHIPASSDSCQLIENPYTCFTMAFTHLAESRRRINKVIERFINDIETERITLNSTNSVSNSLIAKFFEPDFIEKLNAQMYHSNNWAFNSFKAFLEEKKLEIKNAPPITNPLTYHSFQQKFLEHINKQIKSISTRSSAKNYLANINKEMHAQNILQAQKNYNCSSLNWIVEKNENSL